MLHFIYATPMHYCLVFVTPSENLVNENQNLVCDYREENTGSQLQMDY
jgi:hypothetical protein